MQERHSSFTFCSRSQKWLVFTEQRIQDYKPKEIFPFLHIRLDREARKCNTH